MSSKGKRRVMNDTEESYFFGSGTVYVTDGKRGVRRCENHDYEIKEEVTDLCDDDRGDGVYLDSEVIVVLGSSCKINEAIRQISMVLDRLKLDAADKKLRHTEKKLICLRRSKN